jgi:hypothetical protein
MKSYIKPILMSLKDDALMIQAESQYSVFITSESCPGNACQGDIAYELGEARDICFGQDGAPQEGSSTEITCEGLDGTFHLVFESLEPSSGDCGGGDSFIVVFTSPDLPADCVVTSLQTGQGDQCTQSCNS